MKTIKQFIREHNIKFAYKAADSNPPMGDNMDHYRCRLRIDDRKIIVKFSKGYGHHGKPPTLREVLACLADDSQAKGYTFHEFCDNYGYDPDSRTAHRTFKACVKLSEKLEYLLGAYAVEDLTYNTERE